jgi:hypothetical protein
VKNIFRIAFIALIAAALHATTVIPMSIEDLTRASSDVIEGHAVRSWTTWNAQHTLIYTYTTFEVSKKLKGAGAQTMTVKQVGGSADGYTQKVSGVRQFQVGEDALLFLRPSVAADGSMVVVGLIQGNFRMAQSTSGETIVSNGVVGANQIESGRVANFAGSAMRLADAEARVRSAQ